MATVARARTLRVSAACGAEEGTAIVADCSRTAVERGGAGEGDLVLVGSGTVSYTHLTLPTKA